MEQRRRFRIAGHWPLHLVPQGATRPIRRKFPEARKLHLKSGRQIASTASGRRPWTVLSVELARRISARRTLTRDESITPLPGRYDRSADRISCCQIGGGSA